VRCLVVFVCVVRGCSWLQEQPLDHPFNVQFLIFLKICELWAWLRFCKATFLQRVAGTTQSARTRCKRVGPGLIYRIVEVLNIRSLRLYQLQSQSSNDPQS